MRGAGDFAVQTSDLWTATALIALAAAAHQGWSANLLTLLADPCGRAVASVVGFGGMSGAMEAMLTCQLCRTGAANHRQLYQGIFALIGGSYLVALLVIHLLAPRLGHETEQ